jgi:hypothetical protein
MIISVGKSWGQCLLEAYARLQPAYPEPPEIDEEAALILANALYAESAAFGEAVADSLDVCY